MSDNSTLANAILVLHFVILIVTLANLSLLIRFSLIIKEFFRKIEHYAEIGNATNK